MDLSARWVARARSRRWAVVVDTAARRPLSAALSGGPILRRRSGRRSHDGCGEERERVNCPPPGPDIRASASDHPLIKNSLAGRGVRSPAQQWHGGRTARMLRQRAAPVPSGGFGVFCSHAEDGGALDFASDLLAGEPCRDGRVDCVPSLGVAGLLDSMANAPCMSASPPREPRWRSRLEHLWGDEPVEVLPGAGSGCIPCPTFARGGFRV